MEKAQGIWHLIGFLCVLALVGLAWAAWRAGEWMAQRAWWGRLP